MASVTVGGATHDLAGLRLSDVRALSHSGTLVKLSKLATLEAWEQMDSAAEVVAVSIRRAGGKVTQAELLEAATAQELPAVIAAVTEVLALSGFVSAPGGGDPNAPSPTPSTSGG